MKSTAIFVIALASILAHPAYAYDKKERIQEGVRLHDKGDFEGAMTVYRTVLKDYPHDPTAVYELAFSWVSSGKDLAELAGFIEREFSSGTEQTPQLFQIQGWAYDALGDYGKGEAALRRGVEAKPDDARSHYNLGVNLKYQKRFDESLVPLLQAIELDPRYASPWFAVGDVETDRSRPTRAFLSYARAVALEPGSKRGETTARKLRGLLFTGVTETTSSDATRPPEKGVTIELPSAKEPAQGDEEGSANLDPELSEAFALRFTAALRWVNEWKERSDAEFFAYALGSVPRMLSELVTDDDRWASLTLPWFGEVDKAGHTEALAYTLLRAAGNPDAETWARANAEKLKAFEAWREKE